MTGFTKCLRRCFRAPAADWRPLRHTVGKEDAERIRVKITAAAEGRDQIDIKVKYPTFEDQQQYLFECFLFFPKELEAVKLSEFYSHLWETVKLHKPQVSLAVLASKDADGSALVAISRLLQEVILSKGKANTTTIKNLEHHIQLQGCLVRRAIRKATKRVQLQISDAAGSGQDASLLLPAASSMIFDLVQAICQAVGALHEVCTPCDDAGMPPKLSQTWSMCEEWLLVEAERAMLRLIWQLDNASPQSQKQKAMRSTGWQISALRPPSQLQAEAFRSQGSGPLGPSDVGSARVRLQQAALDFQNSRQQRGFGESLIHIGDPYRNESYTHRTKVLKRHGQEIISLVPKVKPRSQALNDVAGIIVAAVAMIVAVFGLWLGYRFSNYQLDIKFVIITVAIYSLKDRIKKWGERYLEPVAAWFGCSFPDRIIQLVDSQNKVVGRSTETCRLLDAANVDKVVQECRWQEHQADSSRALMALPEHVLHFAKTIKMDTKAMVHSLRKDVAVDNVMRIDLRHFCRRMEPATEPHFCMRQGLEGTFAVDKIACARVYHVNVVVRITKLSGGGPCCDAAASRMQMDRTRLILDHGGLLRLEALGLEIVASAKKFYMANTGKKDNNVCRHTAALKGRLKEWVPAKIFCSAKLHI